MMNHDQYLLSKLAEECNEVGQRAMKAQQFGFDEVQPGQPLNNLERLAEEMHDLIATWLKLTHDVNEQVERFPSTQKQIAREEKMAKFVKLSRRFGMVE